MTLYENEKTLHSVTHDFDHLDIRNEKSGLRTQEYDFTDQPPPYEAHFATPISYPSPNPSREAHRARPIPHLPQQSSTLLQQPSVGPSSATILPCVIPRESPESLFMTRRPTDNNQKYPSHSAVLLGVLSLGPTHLLSHLTTSLSQISSPSLMG